MFTLLFVMVCILTDKVDAFEFVYFLMCVIDIAWAVVFMQIADYLRTAK